LLHGPAAHGSPNLGARKITHQAYTITLYLVLLTLLFVHTQSRHNTKDKALVATKISFVNLDIELGSLLTELGSLLTGLSARTHIMDVHSITNRKKSDTSGCHYTSLLAVQHDKIC